MCESFLLPYLAGSPLYEAFLGIICHSSPTSKKYQKLYLVSEMFGLTVGHVGNFVAITQ